MKRRRRMVVDVPDGIDDLVIVHQDARVHHFQHGFLVEEPAEDLKEVTRDKAHRIRFPTPTVRKTLRLALPAGVGSVELVEAGNDGGDMIALEEGITDGADRLSVEVSDDVGAIIMESAGSPQREVYLREDDNDPDPNDLVFIRLQVEIPPGVDVVRVEHGYESGGGHEDTFAVIHAPEDAPPPPDKKLAATTTELVISDLPGGNVYYRLEFAHPDGNHFTEIDEDEGPITFERMRVETPKRPHKKPDRVFEHRVIKAAKRKG